MRSETAQHSPLLNDQAKRLFEKHCSILTHRNRQLINLKSFEERPIISQTRDTLLPFYMNCAPSPTQICLAERYIVTSLRHVYLTICMGFHKQGIIIERLLPHHLFSYQQQSEVEILSHPISTVLLNVIEILTLQRERLNLSTVVQPMNQSLPTVTENKLLTEPIPFKKTPQTQAPIQPPSIPFIAGLSDKDALSITVNELEQIAIIREIEIQNSTKTAALNTTNKNRIAFNNNQQSPLPTSIIAPLSEPSSTTTTATNRASVTERSKKRKEVKLAPSNNNCSPLFTPIPSSQHQAFFTFFISKAPSITTLQTKIKQHQNNNKQIFSQPIEMLIKKRAFFIIQKNKLTSKACHYNHMIKVAKAYLCQQNSTPIVTSTLLKHLEIYHQYLLCALELCNKLILRVDRYYFWSTNSQAASTQYPIKKRKVGAAPTANLTCR